MNYLHKIIIFDLETTGLDFKKDRIIEFGALELTRYNKEDSLEITNEYNILVKPGMPITNSDIHHITDEMVEEKGIDEEEFYNKIKNLFAKQNILVAYNAQFDLNFIQETFKRQDNTFNIDNQLLDVMAIYKDRYEYPHKLDDAVAKFNINIKNTHRALDDVKATYEVLKKLIQEENNVFDYMNKFGYNKKYGVNGIKFDQVTYIPHWGGSKEISKTF